MHHDDTQPSHIPQVARGGDEKLRTSSVPRGARGQSKEKESIANVQGRLTAVIRPQGSSLRKGRGQDMVRSVTRIRHEEATGADPRGDQEMAAPDDRRRLAQVETSAMVHPVRARRGGASRRVSRGRSNISCKRYTDRGAMKLHDTNQNDDDSLSESTWTDSFHPSITVQRAQKTVQMSQVQLIDKPIHVLVSTQEQVPAARVARRTDVMLRSVGMQQQFSAIQVEPRRVELLESRLIFSASPEWWDIPVSQQNQVPTAQHGQNTVETPQVQC